MYSQEIFPQATGTPFPRNFRRVVMMMMKHLFRFYAHVYHGPFDKVVQLGGEAQLNKTFKHFYVFIHEFSLVQAKELAPLKELTDVLLKKQWVDCLVWMDWIDWIVLIDLVDLDWIDSGYLMIESMQRASESR